MNHDVGIFDKITNIKLDMSDKIKFDTDRRLDPYTFDPLLELKVIITLEKWLEIPEKTEEEVIDEITEFFRVNTRKYFRDIKLQQKLDKI